ncbi:MAG: sensor histidine kinase [Leptolyngbyaceae cyanobacterium CRU_2_3]|nr:sensor histidine kinase [Leptolyngbyaceae cyanobacterium CRU_2_3]
MTFSHSLSSLPLPSVSETNPQGLQLASTLAELPLHHFQVSAETLGQEVAQMFERYPLLPGAILMTNGEFLGSISRQRFLEFLIRPQGIHFFLPKPLSILHSYIRDNSLILPAATSIIVGAQMALRRPLQDRSEPIVVQVDAHTYRLLDIHELNIAYWQIRGLETQVRYERTQMQMLQTEKMASLGRLVDGVAHEILDPVGFIWGNLVHVSTYTSQLMKLLEAYTQHVAVAPEAIAQLQDEIELDYLRQDLPQTITSMRAGAERLKKLVTSLQNFCHIDDVYPKPANLHESLDSVLLLLKSRLNSGIEIIRDYGHLPPITCYAGQLNQVFINILTNAVDALLNQSVQQSIAEDLGHHPSAPAANPQIIVTTRIRSTPNDTSASTRWVSIQIADNGPGLSAERQQQIFEAFSVEKRAAKETSLGVSYQIVTAKHGGKLYLRSPRTGAVPSETSTNDNPNSSNHDLTGGSGTEFEILLPLL